MSRLFTLPVFLLVLCSLAYAEEGKTDSTPSETKHTKSEQTAPGKQGAEDPEKIDWSKVDWRKRLTRMQYYVLRQAGTERAFQNKFWDFFKPGEYRCAGCGLPLFEADAKFESDCGWPSFDKTIAKDAITEHVDYKIGYPRTEIRCRRCQSHLGHVFNDGPTETGLRYCLNSAAMKFVHEKQLAAATVADKSAKKATTEQAPKGGAQNAVAKAEGDAKAKTE
ncbi:MAG TPA: peptide-methionine (R)-S-oxide reductase MsrB [Lacipirellula sp.]